MGDFWGFSKSSLTLSDHMVFTDGEIRKNSLKYLDNEMISVVAGTGSCRKVTGDSCLR